MTKKPRISDKESGMFILTIALGILGAIIGALYSAYYVDWLTVTYPKTNWGFTVIWSSIVLVFIVTFLLVFAFWLIRRNKGKTETESEQPTWKIKVKSKDKEIEVTGTNPEEVQKIFEEVRWKHPTS
jgi:Na+/proline symporter